MLVACGGQAGSSEVEVYTAESGSSLWSQSLPTARFGLGPTTDANALRVMGYDNCGDSFTREYDRTSGKLLRSIRQEPSDGFDTSPSFDPPSPCPGGVRRRVSLAPDRLLDVCGASGISVRDVKTGTELFADPSSRYEVYDVGLFIWSEQGYSLRDFDGTQRWTWPLPAGESYAFGADAARIYILADEARDVYALSVRDGTVAWQAKDACGWASLDGGLVVCGRTTRASECEED